MNLKLSSILLTTLATLTSVQVLAQSKYFVIQNIATDRTRVYERCFDSANCSHKMILETKTLFGLPSEGSSKQDKERFRTWLGSFKISDWKKFYNDSAKKHAPWWGENFPALPKKGATLFQWIDSKYMPKTGYSEEGTRGAFGWYAAILTPSPDGQWLHGTYGWGADKDKFMDKYVEDGGSAYLNMSSGCSRVENRAAAWMNHNLPVGTEIYRVYALEELKDERLSRYPKNRSVETWNWILTKEKSALTSDADSVRRRGISADQILETGSLDLDQYPDKVGIKNRGSTGRNGRSTRDYIDGNNYKISKKDFRGVYLVDEGRLSDYAHPAGLTVHKSNHIPADLRD